MTAQRRSEDRRVTELTFAFGPKRATIGAINSSVPEEAIVHRRHLALILCLAALPLVFVACGGDDDEETTAATETSTTASGGGETIDISETEYALDPSEASAAAGEVTFAIVNDGAIPHNLEIEGDGVEEVSETVEGGASTDLTVDLAAGTYRMYCNIADHAEQGMEGEVTVE